MFFHPISMYILMAIYFFSASVDGPVVAIKRELVAEQGAHPGPRRQILRVPMKALQFWHFAIPEKFRIFCRSSGFFFVRMQRSLPFEHFSPGQLVVGIVYLDDVVHVPLAELIISPAPAFKNAKKIFQKNFLREGCLKN